MSLVEDQSLPMLLIKDKASKQIVAQVYNFVDLMGGVLNLSTERKRT